jgi:signal transduction histidine kinase
VIQWIQVHKWLSPTILATSLFALFGSLDFLIQGPISLIPGLVFALSLLIAARLPQYSSALIAVATALEIALRLRPVATGLLACASLFVVAVFGKQLIRRLSLALTVLCGVVMSWQVSFSLPLSTDVYGLLLLNQSGRFTGLLLGLAVVFSFNGLFWILGRLGATQYFHVGSSLDKAVARQNQAQLAIQIAEQNERLEIARDINELIIQKVTAVISLAEGGSYAVKADPAAGLRSLERVAISARDAHTELRRLYDMLHREHTVTSAPPGLDDLQPLMVAYREFGYNASLRHEGPRFEINEGAALTIFKLVFDALENIKKHTPVGTDVTVDFSWVEDGMQVLVKDNGIEVSNRGLLDLNLEDSGYTAEDDLKALVEPISGPGFTAMRERAAIYGGSVEVTKVPGVGFTVSAIFPRLREFAAIAPQRR